MDLLTFLMIWLAVAWVIAFTVSSTKVMLKGFDGLWAAAIFLVGEIIKLPAYAVVAYLNWRKDQEWKTYKTRELPRLKTMTRHGNDAALAKRLTRTHRTGRTAKGALN